MYWSESSKGIRTNRMCIHIDLCKELIHVIVVVWWAQSDGGGQQAGDSGKSYSSSSKEVYWQTRKSWCYRWNLKAVCWGVLSCSGEVSLWFYSDFQLIGGGPLTLWRKSALFETYKFKCKSHPKSSSEKYIECFTKYMDTMAQPIWHITLTRNRTILTLISQIRSEAENICVLYIVIYVSSYTCFFHIWFVGILWILIYKPFISYLCRKIVVFYFLNDNFFHSIIFLCAQICVWWLLHLCLARKKPSRLWGYKWS